MPMLTPMVTATEALALVSLALISLAATSMVHSRVQGLSKQVRACEPYCSDQHCKQLYLWLLDVMRLQFAVCDVLVVPSFEG